MDGWILLGNSMLEDTGVVGVNSNYYLGLDPIFVLIILLFGGFIIFGSLFSTFYKKPFKVLSVKEALRPAFGTGVLGAILGLVAALLISVYPLVKLGSGALLSGFLFFVVFVVGGFAIFFFIGFLYYIVDLPPTLKAFIVYGTIGAVIGLLVWVLFVYRTGPVGTYLDFAMAPVREKIDLFFRELGKFKYCFYADQRCPFFIQWDEAERQSAEELLNIDLSFSDQRILQDRINVLVSMTVKNQELTELKVKPKCYLGKNKEQDLEVKNMGKYSVGDEFSFPLSSSEMHTSFRCYGELSEGTKPVETYQVVVVLERPVTLRATWPIYIGSEPKMGRARTIMPFNAPYSVALFSESDMPYEEGKSYDFSLVIKRIDENSNLKLLREVKINFPETILGECQHFEVFGQSLELFNVPVELLRNVTQYYKKEERYSFPCSLYVSSAPKNAVLSPIELEASYDVTSEYNTQILKSPG
ncbi:MAG: hypothetical protein QXP53_01270 [Candidatus Pacearchaeota archaeon]